MYEERSEEALATQPGAVLAAGEGGGEGEGGGDHREGGGRHGGAGDQEQVVAGTSLM